MSLFASILFLALLAPDAELEKAKAELKKAIAELSPDAVRGAADRISGSDQKSAVDALLDGVGVCVKQIQALWGDKIKAVQMKEANAHFRVNTTTNPPTVQQGDEPIYLRYQEAEKASQAVEARIMRIEECKRALVSSLSRFKADATVKELLKELTGNSSWVKRASVAEALGQMSHADVPAALAEAARKDSEPQVRISAMDSVRELGAAAAVPALVECLKHEFWQVKATAAAALKSLKAKEAVEPLIEALAKADGRLKTEFNEALAAITGVDKHGDAAVWKGWWEVNKDAVTKGTYAPAPGEATAGKKTDGGTTFYGIPVNSRNVVFILDRSGSMMEPSEWEIPNDVATGGGGKDPAADIKKTGDRKIDIARWQLKRALAMMPDGAEFNIIFYSHEWTALSDRMLKLSASTRRQSFDFIDKLDPFGPTNIYDPLEKGLSFASTGAMAEKVLKSGPDTIYFLTDGMPNAGQVPNAPDILVKVKELNKTKKVKIHTVGVFSTPKAPAGVVVVGGEAQLGGAFLKQLAEENGGQYVSAGGKIPDPAPRDPRKK
jgi:hypothetical protein